MSIKTTAINQYNVAVTRQSGKVGNVRYIQRKGETYVRSAKNSKYHDKKSDAQMKQRMKFASLTAFGALLKDYITGGFQTKNSNQTDLNAFIHCNKALGVYRTKNQSETDYVVALPAVIGRGTLALVTTSIADGVAKSNIVVGALPTTIAALSAQIITNNTGWKYGDQLTIIRCYQGNSGQVTVSPIRIFLSQSDKTLLSAFGTFSVVDSCLAIAFADQGCIGFIHSNVDGKVSCSTMAANDSQQTLINEMLSDEVFNTARLTYGEIQENYITGNGTSSPEGSDDSDSDDSDSGATATKYTLTLTASPSAGGTVSGAGQYTAGSTATIKATANSGYTFSGWSDGNTSASRTITVNATQSLTANFTEDSGDDDTPPTNVDA